MYDFPQLAIRKNYLHTSIISQKRKSTRRNHQFKKIASTGSITVFWIVDIRNTNYSISVLVSLNYITKKLT